MAVALDGPVCIAVNQDSIYTVLGGSQSYSSDGRLLTLIKTEHPTVAAENNTWTVISTMPIKNYWDNSYDLLSQILDSVCSVDRNGIFTLRLTDSSGFRYDPMAQKEPQLQSCSADSSSHGEWKQTYVISPFAEGFQAQAFIRPEIVDSGSSNNGGYSDGDEMALFLNPLVVPGPPALRYAHISKEAGMTNLTVNDLSPPVLLSEKDAIIEVAEYGSSQFFSVLAFEPKIPVPGTNRTTYNRTLTYFPFEAPFQLTSPPTAAISIPWNLDCGPVDASVGMVSEAKFYYLCSAFNATSRTRTFKLYIYDSKTRQTRGPLTSLSKTIAKMYSSARLLPVYSATQQDEPQFLVVHRLSDAAFGGLPSYVPTYIDLHASDSSVQTWPAINFPENILVSNSLDPSCRTVLARKKLVVAVIISSLFGIAVAVALLFRWRRKRKSRASMEDDDSLQETLDGKYNAEKTLSTDP